MFNETLFRNISTLIGYLYRPSTKGITAILTYHGISDREVKNCVPVEKFISHLEYINQGFSIIKLSDLLTLIKEDSDHANNYVAITFDDAYHNVYQLAYPELIKRNIPAALFVPAGLVGRYNSWDYIQNQNYPYLKIMEWDQLKELDSDFIEIGSHGYNHRRMASLREDELRTEVIKSKEVLETELNRKINTFAYPYGQLSSFDYRTIQVLKDSGYGYALTSHFGRKNTAVDPYRVKRISIWDSDTVDDVRAKLDGNYDWLESKERLAFFMKNLLKKI